MSTKLRISADLLQSQVSTWQEVAFPLERARLIENDVNRFNEAALTLAEELAFESEPTSFARALDKYAKD